MENFKQYYSNYSLIVERANTHLTHLDELPLTKGERGYELSKLIIKDLLSHLQGRTKRKINTSIKWDGCVHPDTLVVTDQGSKPICELTEQDRVAAFDFNNGQQCYVNPINPRFNSNNKSWVEVELEDGDVLRCTEDHEIYTENRGWVPAKELTSDDELKLL